MYRSTVPVPPYSAPVKFPPVPGTPRHRLCGLEEVLRWHGGLLGEVRQDTQVNTTGLVTRPYWEVKSGLEH